MHFAIHGAEVTVPDFRGMDVASATRKALGMNLDLSVDEHFYSAATPAGHVLTQSPAPGSKVRSDWNVRVTDSLGPQRVAIPKVTGQPERVATLEVRRLGLDLGTIARMPYTGSSGDQVIAQTPQPGAANVDRPNVSLLLGTTPTSSQVAYTMPDFIYQNYSSVIAAATAAHLKLEPPIYVATSIPAVAPISASGVPQVPLPPRPAGVVMSQKPDAGMRIDDSTTLQFTVTQ
jgi:beta-lactam-binding protein with PASTA domain